MFNINLKYFSFFNNKPPASRVAHITRDFLTCYSCSSCSSMDVYIRLWQLKMCLLIFENCQTFTDNDAFLHPWLSKRTSWNSFNGKFWIIGKMFGVQKINWTFKFDWYPICKVNHTSNLICSSTDCFHFIP